LRSPSPNDPPARSGVFLGRGCGRGGFCEDLAEAALGHGGADVGGVARPIEEMGVDVEGDRGACVAEDAADLADVEAQVDDEVAGEGVAEVVEAKRRSAASVEAAALDRVGEGGAGDVSLPERCAQPCCEDVVG
jgi:hypothetical protein